MNKKTFAISALAVFVQYYDYHLFGFLAANVAEYFFPENDAIIQLLNTYLLMSLAMAAKPIGAIILGRIGDIVGRSNSFIIALAGTSVASLLFFIMPSYQTIGAASVLMVLICRMIVCASVSSGSDGVRIFVFENVKSSRQCLGISIITVFTLFGSLAASISAGLFSSNYFPFLNWKYAFLIGSIFGFALIIFIKAIGFKDAVEVKTLPKFEKFKDISIYYIIKTNMRLFIFCVLLAGAIGATNQFIIVFYGTYHFKMLGIIDRQLMQHYVSISIVIYMIFSVISGITADKYGKYKVAMFAGIIILPVNLVQCYYLSLLKFEPIFLWLTAAMLPFIIMPSATILTESIPTTVRYRLFSLSHAIGSIVISAPTAFMSTFLYHKTNVSWLPICYFITVILMILFALKKLKTSK